LLRDGKYCCLGVLEHCLTGQVEESPFIAGNAAGLPSLEWLREHNIKFDGRHDAGNNTSPFLPMLDVSAFVANDCGRYSFKQIADAIEACAEGV
jgi:hypothetical protein